MISFNVPEDSPTYSIFRILRVNASQIGTGLGCHCHGFSNVRLEYQNNLLTPQLLVDRGWEGTVPTISEATILAALSAACKDPRIREIAFDALYGAYTSHLNNLAFLLMSDNLDGIYTGTNYVTRWFAEYLVNKHKFAGVASQIAKNTNYAHPLNHHDQIWILTPPNRFSHVVRDSWGFVGEIPRNTKTWIPPGSAPESEFDGTRRQYAFMSSTEPKIQSSRPENAAKAA